MESRTIAPSGMVVSPHHLASQSALAVLRQGGTAVEATVAAAATISVVYPHMNSIGGDSFWLILPPNGEPVVIEACGPAGSLATKEFYKEFDEIPHQGPKAALTVAGTVAGWQEALKYVEECGHKRMSVHQLLGDAVKYAEKGFPISRSQVEDLEDLKANGKLTSDIKDNFFINGNIPKEGQVLRQPELANTLKHLSNYGLDSFYRGDLAKTIVEDIKKLGMPITEDDLRSYYAIRSNAVSMRHTSGTLYNLRPPTQGLVSLSILGILDNLEIDGNNESEFIHTTVEATKKAFELRDKYITDPKDTVIAPEVLISQRNIKIMANNITNKASTVGNGSGPGDTVWLGVMDDKGFSVSFIQSVYHAYGSGVVLPSTGIIWHNRGVAFSLKDKHICSLAPGKKPFHTLNPAAAVLNDGRIMIYGTRGGDGQPQTQAAVFHRYIVQGMSLKKSISSPRWLYGRALGEYNDDLKIEKRVSEETIKDLIKRGHKIVLLPEYSEVVGHAGALVRHPNGMLEGAFDPRSDGSAVGY